MSASIAVVRAATGSVYYSKEKGNYYTQENTVAHSQWLGKGAEKLGLQGGINAEQFQNLLEGYNPEGTQYLAQKPRTMVRDGKEYQPRAAMDITFSPPKSVSLESLVVGNEKVEISHDIAVQKTIQYIENNFMEVRMGDRENRYKVVTGNAIVAAFKHESSRSKDPQLHTHCVLITASERADGLWRKIQNESIYRNSGNINDFYMNELAFQLKERGIELEKGEKSWEIKGYDRETIKQFSKQTQKIEAMVEEKGITTKKQERLAKLALRGNKEEEFRRTSMGEEWKEELKITYAKQERKPKELSLTNDLEKGFYKNTHSIPQNIHENIVATGAICEIAGQDYKVQKLEQTALKRSEGIAPSQALVDECRSDRTFMLVKETAHSIMSGNFENIEMPQAAKIALDVLTVVTPGLSHGRDFYEATYGKDLIYGHELTPIQRCLNAVSLMTSIPGIRYADEVVEKSPRIGNFSDGGMINPISEKESISNWVSDIFAEYAANKIAHGTAATTSAAVSGEFSFTGDSEMRSSKYKLNSAGIELDPYTEEQKQEVSMGSREEKGLNYEQDKTQEVAQSQDLNQALEVNNTQEKEQSNVLISEMEAQEVQSREDRLREIEQNEELSAIEKAELRIQLEQEAQNTESLEKANEQMLESERHQQEQQKAEEKENTLSR